VRILITNDDGVEADGIKALAKSVVEWASINGHEVVVIAPLQNHSGASAAVGTVYERDLIAYRSFTYVEVPDLDVYGVDASPALSVIIGGLGGFGPKPDLIVSGINEGVNIGRSVLHSGTVGAILTGAQHGLSGIAVSMRSGAQTNHWETPASLAVELLDSLLEAPPRTLWNLNTPSCPRSELKGIRPGHISVAGIIKTANAAVEHVDHDGAREEGSIRLVIGSAVPSLGDVSDERDDDDGALLGHGFASLTPIVGVRESTNVEAHELVERSCKQIDASIS
jgi:5'-nucleotidase